ncbi:MAG TPA: DUF4153 domain-containing protein [Gemmatimonadales bacterium]|nr:DUF4153 domain-containing protein [Gemmatimonadales bacterium]
MRFPSLDLLAARALAVVRRFPWTLAAGAAAATFAIVASDMHGRAADPWGRAVFVALLGLPATIALTLTAEARGWSRAARLALPALALAALALFWRSWAGPEIKHEAIRFAQLAAVLHLAVAFLPFLGTFLAGESLAFWQYNRRLFLGFLRAALFSAVLFVGVAIALGALDHLFGVKIESETYLRIWFVVAFLGNTWIFLAAVPEDLAALRDERDYPRALKVFSQYILTPLAFTYLVILLAYLVKLVLGAEWPSGWIGWLVTSVAVTGLLGFLLVHPLRSDPEEGWIRTYARWLFVGLVPAALMLLVAFWKRILPYGLTEPRVLGVALGLWLLAIALRFALRPATGIRVIPVTLALLLAVTLYGPLSLTRISLASQRDRFARMLAAQDAREASAALRFLVEHRAGREIASVVGPKMPAIAWDSVGRIWGRSDSVAKLIMAQTGGRYVAGYPSGVNEGWFYVEADRRAPTPVAGFAWLVRVSERDAVRPGAPGKPGAPEPPRAGGPGAGPDSVRIAGRDTIRVAFDTTSGVARIRAGRDTFAFDLRAAATRLDFDSLAYRSTVPAATLTLDTAATSGRRAQLRLEQLSGAQAAGTVRVRAWSGVVLVGE